jgi:hypothetical protein
MEICRQRHMSPITTILARRLRNGRMGTLVFDALLRDLGAKDCVREVKLIEMLLGDDTKAHLDDMIAGEFGPLSKVIDESRRILSDLFDMVLVRLILIPPFPH